MKRVVLGIIVLVFAFSDLAYSAESCSPGLSSIIGTEYVADKCSDTGPPYNYIATDIQCVNGEVQKYPYGYAYNYYGQTPESFQAAIMYSASWLDMKVFRNTEGTQFITVNRYFAWGGQLDGVSLGSYASAPSIHYDVFDTYFFPPPSVPEKDGKHQMGCFL